MTQVIARPQKSTIVRLFSIPAPVRASFWLLDRTLPRLSARWAEQMWFTLPPRRARPRTADAAGTPFTVSANGAQIVGETWGEGPAVYLLHGWAGYRGQLTALVEPLVRRGYRVVAFDAPSHGDSGPGAYGPRSSSIPEFATALTAVIAAHGPAHAIVAHSMGSAAAAIALCDGLSAGRLVMVAPMATPMTYAHQFADMLNFGDRTMARLVARVERRIGAPMRHFDIPELGRAIAMPPTLVIHDRDDASTPVADGQAIATAWPTATLHLTSGLGHRRLLRDPDTVRTIVDFI